jgi:hypothetical protein
VKSQKKLLTAKKTADTYSENGSFKPQPAAWKRSAA